MIHRSADTLEAAKEIQVMAHRIARETKDLGERADRLDARTAGLLAALSYIQVH
ncbi:MAG: hypothetical protein RH942_14465 [Kiloniellaceae bacterium]